MVSADYHELIDLLPEKHSFVGVETTPTARNMYTAKCMDGGFLPTQGGTGATPAGAAGVDGTTKVLVFGSEGTGISASMLALCEPTYSSPNPAPPGSSGSVYIPSPGQLKSLNVAASVAVVMFERVRRAFVHSNS